MLLKKPVASSLKRPRNFRDNLYLRLATIYFSTQICNCSVSCILLNAVTFTSLFVFSSSIQMWSKIKSLEFNVITFVVVFTLIKISTWPENEEFSKNGDTLSTYDSGSVSPGSIPKSFCPLRPWTRAKITTSAIDIASKIVPS